MNYRKITALSTAALILLSTMFSGCKVQSSNTSDITDSSNISAAEPDSSTSESDSTSGSTSHSDKQRSVTEIPNGELTAYDEFLQGLWVDESGFIAMFDGDKSVTVYNSINVLEGHLHSDVDEEVTEVKAKITAVDENTISIEADGEKYTAYYADSDKGIKITDKLKSDLNGEWASVMYGAEVISQIDTDANKMASWIEMQDKNETESTKQKYICVYDGGRMKISDSLFSSTYVYPRFKSENVLTMYSDYMSSDLYRKDSKEYKDAHNADGVLNGEWVDPDDLSEVWTFSDDTLDINGTVYNNISAVYEHGYINVSQDGKMICKSSTPDEYDENISVEINGESKVLWKSDSEKIVQARKDAEMLEENAELFEKYPDEYGWTKFCDYGDIVALADAAYIDKYSAYNYFLVGTPQELASFVYYVNTQNSEQGQLTLEITADIDLKGYEWAAMGWSGNGDHPFQYMIYGGGHTIKNMTIDTDDSDIGFIGWSAVGGVDNLHFENARVSGGSNVGVIAGQAIMSVFKDCTASGEVNGSSAGSLVGYEASGNFYNCSADVTVNGESFDYLSWNEMRKDNIKIENPVTITISDDHTVTRPEVEGYINLGWQVFYNGEEVLHRNAEDEYSYKYFGGSPGEYKIYLTAYVEGQYVPISNAVEYTIY